MCEERSHGVSEFWRESVVHGLHFLNPCLRDRKQANTSAVALNVVASIELVIDAAVEAVGIQLPRQHRTRCSHDRSRSAAEGQS